MARLSSNDRQAASVSYTTSTVQLTLAQALQYVVADLMKPMELFLQLPKEVTAAIEKASESTFGKRFAALVVAEQKTVLVEAFSERSTALTLAEALAKVAAGEMKPGDVFEQIPAELKSDIDKRCQAGLGNTFAALTDDQQKMVCISLLAALGPRRGEP